MSRRLTLVSAVAVLLIAGLLPLAAILQESVTVDGMITLSVYRKLFAHPTNYLGSISHTLLLATLTAAIALCLGVVLGLLFAKTDLPLRRTFALLLALPLFMPPTSSRSVGQMCLAATVFYPA